MLDATLVVEQIDEGKAKIIYAWGDAPQWKVTKGYRRYSASVTPGDAATIEFRGGPGAFKAQMNRDLNSLTVSRFEFQERPRTDVETFVRSKP